MPHSVPTGPSFNQDTPFSNRHIGSLATDQEKMLAAIGVADIDTLSDQVVPKDIQSNSLLSLASKFEGGLSEVEALALIKSVADKNIVLKNWIGQGYYNSHMPSVIQRNILENPAWYTAYTPYQPEISQGRLEALLNFQTMVSDLTAMEISNASLLDEASAGAEAMLMSQRASRSKLTTYFVDQNCHPQTIEVMRTRAEPLGIFLLVGDVFTDLNASEVFGALVQYPNTLGEVEDYKAIADALHDNKALLSVATDLLALTVLAAPGEWGADIALGSAQRFGVPMGMGGPHAAFFACQEKFKRMMPGRIIGVSIDKDGRPAYRLSLQTREQHIRREKATSNICTAQALLAILASMYAVYHGPDRLKTIAAQSHWQAQKLVNTLKASGVTVVSQCYFDTVVVEVENVSTILANGIKQDLNLRRVNAKQVGISFDETTTDADVIAVVLAITGNTVSTDELSQQYQTEILEKFTRTSDILTHGIFHQYHSETEMLRYIRYLSDKDLSLDRTMIPLGSCTMKLNATSEMIPVTWPEFANMHPFAPAEQTQGYQQLFDQLEQMLCACTGYDAVSLQPNSGAQGEYAGLMAIRRYHQANGQGHRNICLIPSSAHGTNPASAQLAGMTVVVTACDDEGNIDLNDLYAKCDQHSNNLAAIMVTYPSTHGVFEVEIRQICELIHKHGGQVYLDGANLNAQVGLSAPGKFGADVSHLNLHKTFCIPHGGGGPGVGPIGVGAHLAPYLPGHACGQSTNDNTYAVTAAPYGSAMILPISWMYIAMMGAKGLQDATKAAILHANYIAKRLDAAFPVLYTGKEGWVAHECIIDIRQIKEDSGIEAEDIAKRLMDYGFHAPTMSFPVPGTLMIEPTESESLAEMDRFINAMLSIRQEINDVQAGKYPADNNLLVNAPHTAEALASDWDHPYSREQAAYPVTGLRRQKYWPPVSRVDNVYGDKHLVCSCPPMDTYL
jgi:glycine dehydrogenase